MRFARRERFMALRSWPLIVALFVWSGCVRPLPNSHPTSEAVATAVLRAIANPGAGALGRLALDESIRAFAVHSVLEFAWRAALQLDPAGN